VSIDHGCSAPLIEFTLLRVYISANRLEDARRYGSALTGDRSWSG
jgi:hypothetical protein